MTAAVAFGRLRQASLHLDGQLLLAILALSGVGLVVLYSASNESLIDLQRQGIRLGIGLLALIVIAQISPSTLQRWTPAVFGLAFTALLLVPLIGVTSMGAQRWLDLGVFRFQPSELMKLAVPMAVAWILSQQPLPPRLLPTLIAVLVILASTALIAMQPDLGTAILVLSSGFFVLFLAGLRWRYLIVAAVSALLAAPAYWQFLMHDYQRARILTLLDPQRDPLGSGYHIIQSSIAIGSGGLYGKGWLNSTQARLDFLPESNTDFIFAVFSEEFGLTGGLLLLALYLFIIVRGMVIALHAQSAYGRLLAGALSLTFFVYVAVNIGMVAGLLPVVGVPLPLISYGGTSMVTIMAAFGILMSIHTHRRLWSA